MKTELTQEMLHLLKDIELALKTGGMRKPNQWRDRISATVRKVMETGGDTPCS